MSLASRFRRSRSRYAHLRMTFTDVYVVLRRGVLTLALCLAFLVAFFPVVYALGEGVFEAVKVGYWLIAFCGMGFTVLPLLENLARRAVVIRQEFRRTLEVNRRFRRRLRALACH